MSPSPAVAGGRSLGLEIGLSSSWAGVASAG